MSPIFHWIRTGWLGWLNHGYRVMTSLTEPARSGSRITTLWHLSWHGGSTLHGFGVPGIGTANNALARRAIIVALGTTLHYDHGSTGGYHDIFGQQHFSTHYYLGRLAILGTVVASPHLCLFGLILAPGSKNLSPYNNLCSAFPKHRSG